MEDNFEGKRRALEHLILVVLGEAPYKKLSILHLEKEIFLLWKFHPSVPKFVTFVAHYRGPYSSEITDVIHSPYFLTDAWEYTYPAKTDKYSSGYISLTETGKKEYRKFYQEMKQSPKMHSLLTGITIVRRLYDSYTPDELIYLVYRAYPEYKVNSEVADEIFAREEKILRHIQSVAPLSVSESNVSYSISKRSEE